MSYARWRKDHSDVYVFAHVDGGIECCGCFLAEESWASFRADTASEMINHLTEHRDAGHLVPKGIEFRILGDYPDVNKLITAD